MIFAEITLQVSAYVEFREEGRGEKESMERKQETNGKEGKEVNKYLRYKFTLKYSCVFLQVYTHTR
jgi:hypothetical protein